MKFKAYFNGDNGSAVIEGAFFEAANSQEARKLAYNIYHDKLVCIIEVKRLRCYHTHVNGGECGYTWEYSGRRNKSATCPNCFKQVIIDKAVVT